MDPEQAASLPSEPSLRWRLSELAVILSAAGMVAWLGSKADVYTADAYFYLSKARSLGSLQGLRVSWNDGIDRVFFSGYAFALALPVKLLGESGFWVLAALLHAWTGFSLARVFRFVPISKEARLGALALVMWNPLALWWTSVPMAEALMNALAAASLLYAFRFRAMDTTPQALPSRQRGDRWILYASAILGGLSFFTRPEGVVVAAALCAVAGGRLWRERRIGDFAACVVLFCAPVAAHSAFLWANAIPGQAPIGYLEAIRTRWERVHYLPAFWSHLRSPFWTIFRFDTESWLYAQYFPSWLAVAQSVVAWLYVGIFAFALFWGAMRQRAIFACAAGMVAFAALHALWHDPYERFNYLIYPMGAFLLAWGIFTLARASRWAVLAATLACALISGAYGTELSLMHAARLKLHQGDRDYRSLGRLASAQNPAGRPFVTDLGPYLAFYLNGHTFFSEEKPDFHEAVVPKGELGRVFLAEHRVAAIVSHRPAAQTMLEFGLVPGEYHLVPAPATLLVLDLPSSAGP
jgi:hypothetical protein